MLQLNAPRVLLCLPWSPREGIPCPTVTQVNFDLTVDLQLSCWYYSMMRSVVEIYLDLYNCVCSFKDVLFL